MGKTKNELTKTAGKHVHQRIDALLCLQYPSIMADKYYDSRHFQKILQIYENFRNGNSNGYLDPEELTDVAEYYNSKGCQDEAMEAAGIALHIFPGATAPLAFMARAAILTEGDRHKADKLAEQIIDKSDIEYIYTKAEIMIADSNPEEADLYLQSYMEKTGKEMPEDDRQDFILDVASIFSDYEQYDLCGKWLRLSSLTDTDTYKELRGKTLMGKGRFEECEKLFNELIDNNPYACEYWNHLAYSQFMRNDFLGSITSSEYSIAINPDDEEAIINKANGLFSLGNYEEALEYYHKYTKLNPRDETGEMFQGMALSYLERTQEAITHLETAAETALRNYHAGGRHAGTSNANDTTIKNLIQIYQELAFLESRLGHCHKAMNYLDDMEEQGSDPNMTNVMRGYIQLEHGNTKDAQSFFIKAIHNSHGNQEIMLHTAIAVYDNGYVKTAYRLFHMFIDSTPLDWTDGFSYLARCCFDLGKKEEFDSVLRIAVNVNPSEARYILSDLYPEGTLPEEYLDIDPIHPAN